MLTFTLQSIYLAKYGVVFPFFLAFSLVIGFWFLKVLRVRRYELAPGPFGGTASVLIPVVDEPELLFSDVLSRVQKQHSGELLVVINGPKNSVLEQICAKYGVDFVCSEVASKRHAIATGLKHLSGDVVVLVDSDTLWQTGMLENLLAPFSDSRVGGVTTSQRISNERDSIWTSWAAWLEVVRAEYTMPTMSTFGQVGCLPGRTIAIRREILNDSVERFLTDKFLGVHLEVSDDRSLTNYVLKAGYKTVFQSNAFVETTAPADLDTLFKQQLRWARGSQYNTLRMIPWMAKHARPLLYLYLADIVIPFLILGGFLGWIVKFTFAIGSPNTLIEAGIEPGTMSVAEVIALAIVSSWSFLVLRFYKTLHSVRDYLLLPVYMFINTFFLVPIRVCGFFLMAVNSAWGTRKNAFRGEKERLIAKQTIPMFLGAVMIAGVVLLSVLEGL